MEKQPEERGHNRPHRSEMMTSSRRIAHQRNTFIVAVQPAEKTNTYSQAMEGQIRVRTLKVKEKGNLPRRHDVVTKSTNFTYQALNYKTPPLVQPKTPACQGGSVLVRRRFDCDEREPAVSSSLRICLALMVWTGSGST